LPVLSDKACCGEVWLLGFVAAWSGCGDPLADEGDKLAYLLIGEWAAVPLFHSDILVPGTPGMTTLCK
jgi:hypothetical protein